MRAQAAAFLGDVEARPDLPEAGVDHRAAGATCWFDGDYVQARDHLERALALFQPGRDDDMAFRFGQDQGVSGMRKHRPFADGLTNSHIDSFCPSRSAL